jgi:hypothetical protein
MCGNPVKLNAQLFWRQFDSAQHTKATVAGDGGYNVATVTKGEEWKLDIKSVC